MNILKSFWTIELMQSHRERLGSWENVIFILILISFLYPLMPETELNVYVRQIRFKANNVLSFPQCVVYAER